MRTSHPQGLRDASSFAGSLLLGPFQQHAAANEARKRRRGSYQEPRAMLSAPVATEIVRRTAASAVGGAISANAIASVAHGPFSQAGNTLVWYSIAGMLSASFGASMLPVAKYAWERLEHLLAPAQEAKEDAQEPIYLYGVDVTCSRYLRRPEVMRAAHFAADAHKGQKRLTGDPYIVHCVETAAIVECLHATSNLDEMDERVEAAVVAALLHDVVDDTRVGLEEVRAEFGPRIARIVGQVAQLSTTTQLLRRRRRTHNEMYVGGGAPPPELSAEEEADLRNMILAMVDEPLVLVVKLADRLHNMRTVFALRPDRQCAVAIETMQVWCSLAERLGMFSLKAELEDLCFAVMNPREYRVLRSELDTIWGLPPLSPTSIADAAEKALTSHTAQTPPSDPAPGGPTMLARTSGTSSQAAQGPCAPSQLRACMEAPAAESGQAGPSSNVLTVPGALSSAARRNKDAAVAVSSASADLHTVDQTEHGTHAPSRKPSRSTARGLGSAMEGPGLPAASVGVSGSTAAGSMASVAGAAGSSTAAEERTGGESASGRAATCNLNLTPEQAEAWELIGTVLPFHAVTFRSGGGGPRPSRAVLDVLDKCAHRLLYELKMEGLATGLDVHVEGRIKSLYSMYKKMTRKGVTLREVFDALALRVVVDDQNGANMQRAIEACYEIQPAVHRLWRPIRGELDDYIFNPKASGYQSLHSAVIGPMGVPMEVQIRTSSMHEIAEYGAAAHWAYKDSTPQPPVSDGATCPGHIKVGQPMVRVSTGKLQLGVVVDIEGDKLLVAVVVPSRVLPDTSIDKNQVKMVLAYVRRKKFWAPGHGDLHLSLESYMLCKDSYWHLVDSYNQKQPPFVMPLQNTQKDFDGSDGSPQGHAKLTSAEARKVRLLRRMLEWQRDLLGEPGSGAGDAGGGGGSGGFGEGTLPQSSQVQVLIVPTGKIEQVQRGTTAGDIIRQKGRIEIEEEGRKPAGPRLVNVNNTLVPESTPLGDGDWVSLSPELLDI